MQVIFQREVEEKGKNKSSVSHAGEATPEPRVQRTCAENPLCTEHAQGRVGKGLNKSSCSTGFKLEMAMRLQECAVHADDAHMREYADENLNPP